MPAWGSMHMVCVALSSSSGLAAPVLAVPMPKQSSPFCCGVHVVTTMHEDTRAAVQPSITWCAVVGSSHAYVLRWRQILGPVFDVFPAQLQGHAMAPHAFMPFGPPSHRHHHQAGPARSISSHTDALGCISKMQSNIKQQHPTGWYFCTAGLPQAAVQGGRCALRLPCRGSRQAPWWWRWRWWHCGQDVLHQVTCTRQCAGDWKLGVAGAVG